MRSTELLQKTGFFNFKPQGENNMKSRRPINWVFAWLDMLDSLCIILSFTFWYPKLSFRAIRWEIQKQLKKQTITEGKTIGNHAIKRRK